MTLSDVTTRARHQQVAVRRLGLTPIQLGMLFEGPMQGKPAVNLQQTMCWMPGEALEIPVFEEAWRFVQARHEALRTSYAWVGLDEPEQTVWSEAELVLGETDWRGITQSEVEQRLQGWLAEIRKVGYDVTAHPTIQLQVFHHGSPDPEGTPSTVWVWTNHHLHIDGRSTRLVYEELFDVYERLLDGRSVQVAPAPQFHEHAAVVARQDLAGAEDYVRRRFAGFTEPVHLGLGSPSNAGHEPCAAEAIRVLPTEVMDQLDARARTAGATLGTAMMAAWAIVIGRYSRRDDVVFGSTRAGRHTSPGSADVVGCLINTVPLRADVGRDVTIDELFASLREQQVEIRPYEHMPLVEVQRWSDVPNGTPLFTTDVVFERYRLQDQLRALGGNWTNRTVAGVGDVEIGLMYRGFIREGLELHIDYDEHRFHPAEMERLADHAARMLTLIAASAPDTKLRDLQMIDDAERSELVERFNPDPAPLARTIADEFEAVVARRADHPAVTAIGSPDRLTYRELDERANRLAHRLVGGGVVPDDRVAVFLPRSTSFVEAVLGVVKSCGAWVPIDPTYPAAAVDHMLTDSDARVVLTTAALAPQLPHTGAAVIVLDDDDERQRIAALPSTPPDRSSLRPDHLAYVIYTSGSTGTPKGVLIEQHQLAAYARAVNDVYGIGPDDRMMQFSALSFDTSVEEMWSPLMAGGTLVLRDDATASSITAYLDALVRHRITFAGTPTAFWHLLVQHLEEHGGSFPSHVRGYVIGGEKASRRAFDTFRRLAPDCTLFNSYGPTEATIACTFFRLLPRQELEEGREVPIGSPAPTARIYILDPHGEPMPLGAAGELWVGGPLVGRGYLNRPTLTEDRFRLDWFSSRPGARMYRTGDLARWRADGTIEYLGRIDRQVKFRGYRIEPGEVETVLERHPSVAKSVVGVHGDDVSAKLVAWVLPAGDDRPEPTALRDHCRTNLPSQLVPAAFVLVDRFPETPGGKIDVRALPAPEHRPASRGVATRLGDITGATIQSCFANVLKLAEVGADDSFFDLGGHSLSAMRLIEQLDKAIGRRLTLGDLHQAPTPRLLASLVHGTLDAPAYEHLLPIQPKGTRPPLFGVHVLGPNAGWYRPLAARLGDDQPVMGLWISNPDVTTEVSLEEIARRYADEIDRWCPRGPVGLAGISLGGFVAYELAQQLRARGREITVLALFDTAGPDGRPQLEGGPRLRRHLQLIRKGGFSHVRERVHGKLWKLGEKRRAVKATKLQAAGGEIPPEVWMSRFIELNQAAARNYVVQPYAGKLTVFRATKVSFDRPEAIENGLGWGRFAQDGVEVIDVAGDHMSILAEPHVGVLAHHLWDVLERRHEPRE